VSAKEVGASISVADIQATLTSLEQTYKSEDAAQVRPAGTALWGTHSMQKVWGESSLGGGPGL
jgi:hypothetical protein